MPTEVSPNRYGAVAQLFHWVIVALIIAQYVLANIAEDLPLGMHKLAVLARHKSVGMTILVLALLRLLWRLTHKAPPLPVGMNRFERFAAHFTHLGLYVLLFAMPLSGWMMSSAKNYSVSWFNLFTWPNLIGKDEAAFEFLKSTHEVLSTLLWIIVALHVLAALKHHFWNKDDVMRRMLPFTRTEKRP